jgi:hypothetical protein
MTDTCRRRDHTKAGPSPTCLRETSRRWDRLRSMQPIRQRDAADAQRRRLKVRGPQSLNWSSRNRPILGRLRWHPSRRQPCGVWAPPEEKPKVGD